MTPPPYANMPRLKQHQIQEFALTLGEYGHMGFLFPIHILKLKYKQSSSEKPKNLHTAVKKRK